MMISTTILTTRTMANYTTLKAAVQDAIKQNGNNEITGNLLQSTLIAMIASLGDGYLYKGIATTSMNPGTPDENVFYIAATAGTYTNFGGIVVDDGEVAILRYSGSWVKEVTGAAASSRVQEINVAIWQIQAAIAALNECVSPESVDVDLPYNFEAGYVNANTGAVNTSSTVNTITSKVPVVPGRTLKYIRTKNTATSGVSTGMAFFDSEGGYIMGIVESLDASEYGYEENSVIVPSGAAYAIFTIRNQFEGNFYAKEVREVSAISDLEAAVNGKEAAIPIHYDRRDAVLGAVNSSGNYFNNGVSMSIFIAMTAGRTYRVKNTGTATCYIAVVQDGSYSYSSPVNFADGFTSRIGVAAGNSYAFKAPNNGNYIIINTKTTSSDILSELSQDIVGLEQRVEAIEDGLGLRSVNRSQSTVPDEEEEMR